MKDWSRCEAAGIVNSVRSFVAVRFFSKERERERERERQRERERERERWGVMQTGCKSEATEGVNL